SRHRLSGLLTQRINFKLSEYWGPAVAGHDGLKRRNLTAVEIDRGAVHPGGARGDQEADEIGNVLDLAEAGDAEAFAHLLACFLRGRGGAPSVAGRAPPGGGGAAGGGGVALPGAAAVLPGGGGVLGKRAPRRLAAGADGDLFGRFPPAGAADGDDRAAPRLER